MKEGSNASVFERLLKCSMLDTYATIIWRMKPLSYTP